ncbi:acetylcholine receptor subunit alpha-like [Watersipora subatra]|uniref:acetylcholine receptor subunit alpha-like n=1 Tax=Watersipora subatra TaxID=2589382 RepID=UPI00355B170B
MYPHGVLVPQSWKDEYLSWDPEDYEGIKRMYLPCFKVWLPDIVLYNAVEDIHENYYMKSPVTVDYTGEVKWFPLAKLHSSCKLDIRFYPFDRQVCYLKLGSWSYSELEVDVRDGETGVEKNDFIDNGEFELVEFTVKRVKNHYDCCPIPIITLNVNIHFRRRPMFSIFTVAIPCIMLSLMTIIAFILPPQNEAKIEVQLSVMLSLAVFMLMIGEILPPTSDKIPLIGVHIVIQMGLTALSLVCSVLVLRLVSTDYKDVPEVLRKRAVKLSKFLCMGVPDYLKDKHNIQGKLAILEQHQINLRKHYLAATSENGLNPGALGLQVGMKELKAKAATLVALSSEEGEDSVLKRPLKNGNLHNHCCRDDHAKKLSSIEVIVAKVLELMEDSVLKEQRKAEWSMLGALIDRILLIVLIIAATLTTLYIYMLAPHHMHTPNS